LVYRIIVISMGTDFIFKIFSDKRTVFTLQEIGMLADEPDFVGLKQKIHYFVKRGKLRNLRRGIYAKKNYSPEELACRIFTPSYISLEYVLQKSGSVFQYSSQITCISYLSREISVDGFSLRYRKVKNDILYNTSGITREDNGINIAVPERAFLDYLYLNRQIYLDSGHSLKEVTVYKLLPVYNSEQLLKRAGVHLKML